MEKIEDPEDAIACKKAELEEKNYDIEEIDEFMKINGEQGKEIEEEDVFINFDNLPKIYKYGLDFIRFLNEEAQESANEQDIIEENPENPEEIKENPEEIKENPEEIKENPEEIKDTIKEENDFIENLNESEEENFEKSKSFVIYFIFYKSHLKINEIRTNNNRFISI